MAINDLAVWDKIALMGQQEPQTNLIDDFRAIYENDVVWIKKIIVENGTKGDRACGRAARDTDGTGRVIR
jgi:hypothetical protein